MTQNSEERLLEQFEEYLQVAHGYGRANADTVVGDLVVAVKAAEDERLDEFLPYPERL